jgi:hypothetical protein
MLHELIFLNFLELFFNREMWRDMRWYDMLLEFLELFLMKKVTWYEVIFLNF